MVKNKNWKIEGNANKEGRTAHSGSLYLKKYRKVVVEHCDIEKEKKMQRINIEVCTVNL